jgi:hypothetical protein
MNSFQLLNKLKVLKLNNNLLTSFNSTHLNGLVSLEQLFLNNNFFKQFDNFTFAKFNNSLIDIFGRELQPGRERSQV